MQELTPKGHSWPSRPCKAPGLALPSEQLVPGGKEPPTIAALACLLLVSPHTHLLLWNSTPDCFGPCILFWFICMGRKPSPQASEQDGIKA